MAILVILLAAHGVKTRTVWVADSFEGLPPAHHKEDNIDLRPELFPVLAVSQERVQALFERYGLLDEQVRFLKGFFRDSLPNADIKKLSVLRLDGDYYESTMDALVPLYVKVTSGGFVIVDDYNALPGCKKAVNDFRDANEIKDKLVKIDDYSVYWRKS